jgi:hypothetical protein
MSPVDIPEKSATLNPFMGQGYERWVGVRDRISALVGGDVPDAAVHAVRDVGYHGFGEVRGRIVPARPQRPKST